MDRSIHSAAHTKLCHLLRHLRETAGLRQVDVAERLDVPQSFVSKYESGERRLDLVELRFVCEALGSSLGYLIETFDNT